MKTMMRAFAHWLFNLLFQRVAVMRMPDFVIGTQEKPYLMRWWLFGAKPDPRHPNKHVSRSLFGVRAYLHCFLRSDDDRAHHDHPNASLSLCLKGQCVEHTIAAGGVHQRQLIEAGRVRFRRASFAHRIEIEEGHRCWTLFVFFGRSREWGFHCPSGWVHWKDFTNPSDSGQIGPGCAP